jgi:TolA-binding protein
MMRLRIAVMLACAILYGFAVGEVRIKSVRGSVRVRRGLEENWNRAGINMNLEEIDTIMTEEASRVVLELEGGATFTMESYSILDISDLRQITEKELFLYLMAQKVSRIERKDRTPLHIQNVNVARAERKTVDEEAVAPSEGPRIREWEINGGRALYAQRFYTNAIVKFHKILDKYPETNDAGRLYYYLGSSFEAIDEKGRAMDAFQEVVERAGEAPADSDLMELARLSEEALRRLKD